MNLQHKPQDKATSKEIVKALSEAPAEAKTIGGITQYALMKRALKAIRKGTTAFTF